jgi:hypothetical protein
MYRQTAGVCWHVSSVRSARATFEVTYTLLKAPIKAEDYITLPLPLATLGIVRTRRTGWCGGGYAVLRRHDPPCVRLSTYGTKNIDTRVLV